MVLTLAKLMTELFGRFIIDNDTPIIIRVNYRDEKGYLTAFDEGLASRVAGIEAPMIVIESKNFIRQECPLNTLSTMLLNPLSHEEKIPDDSRS